MLWSHSQYLLREYHIIAQEVFLVAMDYIVVGRAKLVCIIRLLHVRSALKFIRHVLKRVIPASITLYNGVKQPGSQALVISKMLGCDSVLLCPL